MEQLAEVKNIKVGMRDVGRPCMYFEIATLDGNALIIFESDEMLKRIREADVYDITQMNNRVCVVTMENNMIQFLRWKI
jgi:hypothetical protein